MQIKLGIRYSLGLAHLIASWPVRRKVENTVHDAKHKQPINKYKPVQKSKQQVLKSYCSKYIYCGMAMGMCVKVKSKKKMNDE